jgi:hypothetical protein
MSQSRFYTLLIGVALLTIAVEYGLQWCIPELWNFENLFWYSHIFFILLTMVMYYAANIFAASSNKNLFSHFILLVVLTKMLSCILIVVGYFKKVQPSSQLFLVPFAIVYVIYTIFETYFMAKIGNQTKPSSIK